MPVLVLNVGRLVLHHGRVGVIRSLGRMGVPVYAVVEDRFTPAAVSRHLTGAFIGIHVIWMRSVSWKAWPRSGSRSTVRRLSFQPTTLRPFWSPSMPPGCDSGFFSRRSRQRCRAALADKRELYQICKRVGVACPQTAFPSSIADVHEFARARPVPGRGESCSVMAASRRLAPTSIARTPEQILCALPRS